MSRTCANDPQRLNTVACGPRVVVCRFLRSLPAWFHRVRSTSVPGKPCLGRTWCRLRYAISLAGSGWTNDTPSPSRSNLRLVFTPAATWGQRPARTEEAAQVQNADAVCRLGAAEPDCANHVDGRREAEGDGPSQTGSTTGEKQQRAAAQQSKSPIRPPPWAG